MSTPTTNLNWQPPAGFAELQSNLEGITVFGPVKVEETSPTAITFTCPNCGASTNYDPGSASVVCSHCGSTYQINEKVVGEQAEQSEFTIETLEKLTRGWGSERKELHCDACGVDISIEVNDLSTTCPFCGSNQVVNRLPSQEGLRPGSVIPFRITPSDCQVKAQEWLGKGWMHPSDLANAGGTTRYKGIYIPYWTFSASIQSQWEAQVGYERTERYYDSGSKQWQTRTVIDWRWQSGNVSLPVENLLISGTKNISPVLLEKLQPFHLNELASYDAKFLAGWQAKSYDIPLQNAWEVGKSRMREMSKQACYQDIPTSHVRNFSMSADFDQETWRLILIPIYVSAYRYQEKSFQVIVNGQTGSVAGQKPVAWIKVWLAILGLLLPGVIVSLFGLPLLALAGSGIILLIIGVAAFIIGLIISIIILRQAMQAGEA